MKNPKNFRFGAEGTSTRGYIKNVKKRLVFD
jgi:hypothetical protein